MHRFPNEILELIIDYVMLSDEPMFMDWFLPKNPFTHGGVPQKNRLVRGIKTRLTRWRGNHPLFRSKYIPWPPKLSAHLNEAQRLHLWDWCFVNGTCRLFREIGKPAFFARKTFVMGPHLLNEFIGGRVKGLTAENRQIAMNHCAEIIISSIGFYFPDEMLLLPRYIQSFPRLRRLDHMMHCETMPKYDLYCIHNRRNAPAIFTRALSILGVDTDKLDLGFIVDSDNDFYGSELSINFIMNDLIGVSDLERLYLNGITPRIH
ncbi:hypothetical protein FQN55_005140 [Onygenales sp. PD_40]|nr:hypothetical protein FQN55_005140 [Onygenales sp. PD_40]KAK2772896.1 hypothetical protein FQN53_004420 [Emmonsiellopsis sp. PD_33]